RRRADGHHAAPAARRARRSAALHPVGRPERSLLRHLRQRRLLPPLASRPPCAGPCLACGNPFSANSRQIGVPLAMSSDGSTKWSDHWENCSVTRLLGWRRHAINALRTTGEAILGSSQRDGTPQAERSWEYLGECELPNKWWHGAAHEPQSEDASRRNSTRRCGACHWRRRGGTYGRT